MRQKFAGMALGAVAGCAEGTRGEPSLGCIEQRQQWVTGWPELTGTELAAVPEFERRGKEGYGARQAKEVRALGSWGRTKCGGALGRVLARP